MQLARLKIDVAREDIIEDNVLDEIPAVIPLVVVLLYTRERYRDNARIFGRVLIAAFHKDGIIRSRT